jgi:predicted Zn-dependent protease
VGRAADSLTRTDLQPSCGTPCPRQRAAAWGLHLSISFMILGGLVGCSATVGRVVGQQFVSPAYDFEVSLPGDEWKPVTGEPTVLTLTHPHLAAGITINVTCERERETPLNILTRHLFFGFRDMDVLLQERRTLNGVPALKTVARARLDTQDVQVNSYVIQHDGCVYDMVYFASPQDYSGGEATFEHLVAGFRFLN